MTRRRALRCAGIGRSGSALIEFALIAPVLTVLMLGLYDLVPALMIRFKLGSATQAVADLAAQSKIIQTSDIANFFAAGADVMSPFSASTLILRISNIATDGAGNAFVYWSCGQGALTPTKATSIVSSTPNGTDIKTLLTLNQSKSGKFTINGTDTSYILVESQYVFTPVAGFVIPSAQTLSSTAFTMPRVSTYIGATIWDPTYVTPAPTAIRNSYATNLNGVSCAFGI